MMELSKNEQKNERTEQIMHRLWAGSIFLTAMVLVLDASPWTAAYKLLFCTGLAAYYMGYWRFYPVVYDWSMKDHPMRSDQGYRNTDGHMVALVGALTWPIAWPLVGVGRRIVRSVKKYRATTVS